MLLKSTDRIIPTLLCDFYKLSHKGAYPSDTTVIYSGLVPRNTKHFKIPNVNEIVVAGYQYLFKEYLIDFFNREFFNRPKEEVIQEYWLFIKHTLFIDEPDTSHIEKLHDLKYLPLNIWIIEEGSVVPVKTPILAVENTHDDFFWLPNYFETLIACTTWQPITSATIAFHLRRLLEGFAIKTTGSTEGVQFQAHDFSMRGMSSLETAQLSGFGHLSAFSGTDTAPSIMFASKYYYADYTKGLVGASIPATEHSVMSALTPAGGNRDEKAAIKHIMDVYPKGLVSVVSDTYDFWKVVSEDLVDLKDDIMARDGKLVIRPDSGNPVDIICGKKIESYSVKHSDEVLDSLVEDENDENWEAKEESEIVVKESIESIVEDLWRPTKNSDKDTGTKEFTFNVQSSDGSYYQINAEITSFEYYEITYIGEIDFMVTKLNVNEYEAKGLIECLWDIFGGTVTPQGYKVLDSHIGAIYGDSIDYSRAKEICERLEEKGFASTNIVLGIGSFTYQFNTRDSLGLAIKALWAEIDGKGVMLQKDPKTDAGKKSHTGKFFVYKTPNGNYITIDGQHEHLEETEINGVMFKNELKLAFSNGNLIIDTTLDNIRGNINEALKA